MIPRKREQFVFSPRFFVPSSFIQHLLVLSSSWLLNKDDWSTTKASYPNSWHPCLRKAWYSGYWFLKAEIPAPVLRSRNALATCHLHWEVTWPMLSFKQWLGILLIPKIVKAYKNYLTPEIWEETHLREIFYGTLVFQQSSMISTGRHVGGHTLALQNGGQNYFCL